MLGHRLGEWSWSLELDVAGRIHDTLFAVLGSLGVVCVYRRTQGVSPGV
jgi:hypothetical protein